MATGLSMAGRSRPARRGNHRSRRERVNQTKMQDVIAQAGTAEAPEKSWCSVAPRATPLPAGLGVDARMLFHSGIGTVIRSVLQEWHDHACGPKPDVFVPGSAGLD